MAEAISSLLGGANGAPITVEHQGRKFPAVLVKQMLKAQWERWLRLEALREARDLLGNEEAALKAVIGMAAAKAFRWRGVVSNAALGTEEGSIAFAALIFGTPEVEMDVLLKDKEASKKFDAAIEQVIAESFPEEFALLQAKRKAEQELNHPNPSPVSQSA